jgi:hypothetical protein
MGVWAATLASERVSDVTSYSRRVCRTPADHPRTPICPASTRSHRGLAPNADVVGKILPHLGLPIAPPALAPVRSSPGPSLLVHEPAPLMGPALGDNQTQVDGGTDCSQEATPNSPVTVRPVSPPPP